MNCGSGVDFAFGQSSGPEGGTVNPPFLVRTGIWMVDCLMPPLIWKVFLDCPCQEVISTLSELEGRFV